MSLLTSAATLGDRPACRLPLAPAPDPRGCARPMPSSPSDGSPPNPSPRPQTLAVVAMKIFVEEQQFFPRRIVGKARRPAVTWPAPAFVRQKQPAQSRVQFVRDLTQIFELAGPRRTFHPQAVAVKMVIPLERLDQQIINRHPDRAAPVGIAAKQARARFTGLVTDPIFVAIGLQHERMFAVHF